MSEFVVTRSYAREAFFQELNYDHVRPVDIVALEGYLTIEGARYDAELMAAGRPIKQFQPSHEVKCRRVIVPHDSGGILAAYLRVDSTSWNGREAISFHPEGYIEIAEWADEIDVQPFLRAFMLWLVEWMRCTRVFSLNVEPRSWRSSFIRYRSELL